MADETHLFKRDYRKNGTRSKKRKGVSHVLPHFHLGFFQALWFPPTTQIHASKLNGDSKQPSDVNMM